MNNVSSAACAEIGRLTMIKCPDCTNGLLVRDQGGVFICDTCHDCEHDYWPEEGDVCKKCGAKEYPNE